MTDCSPLLTDAYKFSMAQAGFPLRRETFYLSFRHGGFQHVPIDLDRAVRSLLADLRASEAEAAFTRAHGYGLTDAMDRALADKDGVQIEAVPRGAVGRMVLSYLPTYGPWLNPIEMLRRHFRREVTHCELCASIDAVLQAAREFFDRCNRTPERVRSVIGAHPA